MNQSNNPYQDVPFSHLCDARPNTDAHQDQLLALWEKQPKTEDEAKAILKTLHFRHEWARRNDKKRGMPLDVNMEANQIQPNGELMELIQSLPASDRRLIEDHVLNEMTLAQIAERDGCSKRTISGRFTRAKRKLQTLSKNTLRDLPSKAPYK
jgi:RNA polymerase sigma factor (sigma-70 family)